MGQEFVIAEHAGELVPRFRKQRSDFSGGEKRDITRRTKPFIAWDGEGYTHDGRHTYALFGSSRGLRVYGDLSWRECLPLLMESPKEAHHVIFAGTYDIVMMFRDIERVSFLLKGFPIYLDQYRIQFLRGKFLKVTDRKLKTTRILYDVFTFFGCSFVKACREYLGDLPILDEVQAMKEQRNTFTASGILEDSSVETYMGQELDLLVDLCTDLRDKLAKVNIHPQYWHGPGAVASTILKTEKVKPHQANGAYDDTFRRCAEAAYYGGRFEQFQRGTHESTVYQYDIRSAYPAAMRFLRSLDSTVWDYRLGRHARDTFTEYGLYYVDWESRPEPISIGWLPYRHTNGNIYYPPYFAKGWYWGIEIPPHLCDSIVKGYYPILESEPTYPLTFVADMYTQRAALKRARQPHQLALKLGLNSIYGKLAQSKGAKLNEDKSWVYPTFHEVVWSGWITAYTRRKIADALHSVPQKLIIATETDSVFSLVPLDVPVSEQLGDWECETLEGIKYIQSGVSLVKKGGEWHFKTRGFTVKRTQNEVELWAAFLESDNPTMTIRQTRFSTDPRTETFGNWFETEHTLSLNERPNQKRIHIKAYCMQCKYEKTLGNCLHGMLVPKIAPQESTPYSFIWNMPLEDGDVFARLLQQDDPNYRLEYV